MTNIVQFAEGIVVRASDFGERAVIPPAGEPNPPVLTYLSGNASVDDGVADGVAQNNVTFTASDQDWKPIEAHLILTCSSSTANISAETISTDPVTGTATTSMTDTVAEEVVVTATVEGSDVTATATTTFMAPASRAAKSVTKTHVAPAHKQEQPAAKPAQKDPFARQ
jgi:hypothetical protein